MLNVFVTNLMVCLSHRANTLEMCHLQLPEVDATS